MSRRKGAAAERELCAILREHYPEAKRNLDQFGDDKRDVLSVKGVHFQVKRQEKIAIWQALAQAESEAQNLDLPVVAFRRSRSEWQVALALDEFLALLRLRDI